MILCSGKLRRRGHYTCRDSRKQKSGGRSQETGVSDKKTVMGDEKIAEFIRKIVVIFKGEFKS